MILNDERAAWAAGERGIYDVELIDESRTRHNRQEDAFSRRRAPIVDFERVQ